MLYKKNGKKSEIEIGKEFIFEYGPITRDQINSYAQASSDLNPIHTNEKIAEQMMLKGVIAHGMLSFGIMARFVSDLAGDGKVVKIGGEMRGMVRPGDFLLIKASAISIEGNMVNFKIIEESKTKIKIERDGEIVQTFEAEERGWISEKDRKKDLIKTEETEEGKLYYRLRTAIPTYATLELVD